MRLLALSGIIGMFTLSLIMLQIVLPYAQANNISAPQAAYVTTTLSVSNIVAGVVMVLLYTENTSKSFVFVLLLFFSIQVAVVVLLLLQPEYTFILSHLNAICVAVVTSISTMTTQLEFVLMFIKQPKQAVSISAIIYGMYIFVLGNTFRFVFDYDHTIFIIILLTAAVINILLSIVYFSIHTRTHNTISTNENTPPNQTQYSKIYKIALFIGLSFLVTMRLYVFVLSPIFIMAKYNITQNTITQKTIGWTRISDLCGGIVIFLLVKYTNITIPIVTCTSLIVLFIGVLFCIFPNIYMMSYALTGSSFMIAIGCLSMLLKQSIENFHRVLTATRFTGTILGTILSLVSAHALTTHSWYIFMYQSFLIAIVLIFVIVVIVYHNLLF